MSDFVDLLLSRRSVLARDIVEPGPSSEELDTILRCAHRVPDHGKIGPWRFVVIAGEARERFGASIAEIFLKKNPDTTEKCLQFEAERFTRAPLVIAVIYSPDTEHKVPEWEQVLSTGAACENILLACTAQGYACQWLTEWYSYDEDVKQLLKLANSEKVAGFIYIGSKEQEPSERKRPELEARITHY